MTARIVEQFRNMSDTYKKAGTLSYAMKYTYANESTPASILDSLTGNVEINTSGYRCVIDSTETISNDRYAIMLFKKDKVMYLSKPSKNQAAFDALSMMDSTLAAIPGLKGSIALNNNERIITLSFPAGNKYKEIRITADTTTGYIKQARYIVKTEQLLDPQLSKASVPLTGYDAYAIVDLKLYDYTKKTSDSSIFDEKTFFHKEGKEYKTTEAYKDYKIFLGTPNL